MKVHYTEIVRRIPSQGNTCRHIAPSLPLLSRYINVICVTWHELCFMIRHRVFNLTYTLQSTTTTIFFHCHLVFPFLSSSTKITNEVKQKNYFVHCMQSLVRRWLNMELNYKSLYIINKNRNNSNKNAIIYFNKNC